MMYDELIKRLRNCATQAAPCKTCDMIEDGSCSDTLMKQAADAIEELQKRVPKTPHGRLIDADTLIEAVKNFPYGYRGMILSLIENAPTIIEAETCNNTEDACNKDVDTPVNASKTGKWIERGNCEYKCSICGKIVFADDENELNYCCNCGARMAKE